MARTKAADPLATYRTKRDFSKTPEPPPERRRRTGNSFVLQKHAARRTHFDFRLEHDGVLKSWAVTKGPSLDPSQKRLAVMTEDHPLEYGSFEGVIPKGQYGAGPVMIWDRGTWEPIGDTDEGLAKGDLKFRLFGDRLKGDFVLVRMKPRKQDRGRQNWLLIKKRDAYSGEGDEPTLTYETSVKSGRTMNEIETGDVPIWSSKAQKKSLTAKASAGTPTPPKTRRAIEPEFIAPELATLVNEVPGGPRWLHEVKYDGYRIIARKAGDEIALFSRSGLDWTVRFPAIAKALQSLPCETALLDGEIAFVLPSGITSFKSLQEHIDTPHPAFRYFLFDLLSLDGKNWRDKSLTKRKDRLQQLMSEKALPNWLVYSDHVQGSGGKFYREACSAGLEGVVSKRADSTYVSGRTKNWLKTKCHKRAELVIGGYSRSSVRGRPFSSLLLGAFADGKFNYAGKVGTGFSSDDLTTLAKRFKPLERSASPFVEVPVIERKDAVWLKPTLVCEVAYTEWTNDGRLRHPSFQGLREDKRAAEVRRDHPRDPEADVDRRKSSASKANGDPIFDGIKLTSPDKVLYPDIGVTKLALANYYETVAPTMLPFVVNRPISLVRCPEGCNKECFFQRHAMKGMSDAIKQIAIPGGESKEKYLYLGSEAGLFGLAQIGVLEIHDWGVSLDHLYEPDRLVFDLDPDEGLAFDVLKAAAIEVRDFLADLGLKSFLKSTGGKGLHVVAPITPKQCWDEVKAFTKAVADTLVEVRSDRYTANPLKRTREGKIFVDYLRNQRGGSAIVNYSTRATPNASVACPLDWDELKGLKVASPYTLMTLPARLAAKKRDPWERFFSTRQSITAKVRKALGLG
ncbi:MAG TPA: DNA ligase D [Methyloceanibacter sp.]|nr:DNA ligase D [Methyloceanibacter sp.]